MLKIIIKNPAELARQRGVIAGLAADVAPALIRQIVDVEFARQLRTQMAAQGVKAEVLIEANPQPRGAVVIARWVLWLLAAALLLAGGALTLGKLAP